MKNPLFRTAGFFFVGRKEGITVGHGLELRRPSRAAHQNADMTPPAPHSATLAVAPALPPAGRLPLRDASVADRFGAAAPLLDRLDTRPIEQRQPARPWWRLW